MIILSCYSQKVQKLSELNLIVASSVGKIYIYNRSRNFTSWCLSPWWGSRRKAIPCEKGNGSRPIQLGKSRRESTKEWLKKKSQNIEKKEKKERASTQIYATTGSQDIGSQSTPRPGLSEIIFLFNDILCFAIEKLMEKLLAMSTPSPSPFFSGNGEVSQRWFPSR